MADDDSPWGDLDSAFDKLSNSKVMKLDPKSTPSAPDSTAAKQDYDFEEAIFAQAGAAAVGNPSSDARHMDSLVPGNNPFGGATGPHIHQSWSEYMGGAEVGDDSPWASLDAFADQSFDASAVATPMHTPFGRAQAAVQSTPRFHSQPTEGTLHSGAYGQSGTAQPYTPAAATPYAVPESHVAQEVLSSDPQADLRPRLTHVEPGSGRAAMVDVGHKAYTRRTATATGRVYLPSHTIELIRQAEGGEAGETSLTTLTKGPVLHTAQLAGIMAAKKTSDLIPLCHGLSLSHVDVTLKLVDAAPAPSGSAAQSGSGSPLVPAGSPETGITGFTLDQLDDPDSWASALSEERAGPSPAASGTSSLGAGAGYVDISCTASTSGQTGVEMEALTGCTVACLTIWDMVKAVAGKEMTIGDIKVVRKTGGKSGDWTRTLA
ncbi:uncharacterized protein PSFLO_00374 [Pseudozyma flocculosa]|uniref:cyclic pyranopterin monophosphate synthase n=2 Tax=Pseudozyma flocculosa TaxID=84751 RepID=A0A5C3ERF6_9BASI|nr:uncharacterized protein PSFLO_00374 [Pseudozyma flocculosa]